MVQIIEEEQDESMFVVQAPYQPPEHKISSAGGSLARKVEHVQDVW